MNWGAAAWLGLRYAVAIAALIVFLFPLYWLVVTAMKTPEEVLTYPPVWWPATPQFKSFEILLERETLWAIGNSFIVAVLSMALAMALGTMSAYALARSGFGGRFFAASALASRLVPPVLLALLAVLAFGRFGWAGSLVTLVAVLTVFNLPYVMWMMRGYFRDVPVALEETALVAGLTRRQLPVMVAWPIVRGGFFATAAFTFVLAWNELAFALVLADEGATTLPVLLAEVGTGPEAWGGVAALCLAAIAPVIVALAVMHGRLARTLSLGLVRD